MARCAGCRGTQRKERCGARVSGVYLSAATPPPLADSSPSLWKLPLPCSSGCQLGVSHRVLPRPFPGRLHAPGLANQSPSLRLYNSTQRKGGVLFSRALSCPDASLAPFCGFRGRQEIRTWDTQREGEAGVTQGELPQQPSAGTGFPAARGLILPPFQAVASPGVRFVPKFRTS